MIFAAATATWLGNILYYYLVLKKKGEGKIPGLEQSYIAHSIAQLESKDSAFKINFLIAVVAASFWFKVLMMLQLTKTFGPMIKIVVSMLKDLATFSVLWIIQLFIFACIGFLIFGELDQYQGLTDTVILLL